MASIKRRPDGSWRARFRDPEGREYAHHAPTRAAAQRWLDQQTASIVRGDYVDPKAGRVTFREYADDWRTSRPRQRASTRALVEQHLRLHVYPTLGHRPMRAIKPSDVQALVTNLSSQLAPGTVEVVYGRLAAVFRSAVRDRVLASSPCVEIERPARPDRSKVDVLEPAQVVAIADAMPARYRALVLTAAGTGLRPGELFGLSTDRIDFLRRSLRVDRQLVRVRGQSVALAPLKTASSDRTVPLPTFVADVLAAHLAAFPTAPVTFSEMNEPVPLVFTNERGMPIQQHPFSVLWARARDAAGAPAWATPHDLRHHYASLLIRSGASVTVVQARLGHKLAKTTLDTYAKLWPDDEERTRAAVDDAFGNLADFSRTGEARSG